MAYKEVTVPKANPPQEYRSSRRGAGFLERTLRITSSGGFLGIGSEKTAKKGDIARYRLAMQADLADLKRQIHSAKVMMDYWIKRIVQLDIISKSALYQVNFTKRSLGVAKRTNVQNISPMVDVTQKDFRKRAIAAFDLVRKQLEKAMKERDKYRKMIVSLQREYDNGRDDLFNTLKDVKGVR